MTNAYVQLNSERYPEENLNINFNKNHFVKPYKMAADFHKIFINKDNTTFSVDQDDYKNIYPIYAFDVSKQTERLKNSPIDVRISATFKDAVGHSRRSCFFRHKKQFFSKRTIILSDESQLSLLKDISNKVSLYIPYLNRQCERLSILQNSRDLDWKLNISAGSERPRYIFLCFQEAKENSQKVNPSNFDHLQVTNAYVQLNSERYPEENLNINFNKNHFVKPYKMAADFHKIFGDNTTFSVDQDDYKNIYPIYAFDVSKQTERLKNSPIDVRISATFKDAVGHSNAIAYALILSDKIINLQSDGNKMIVY